MTVTIGRRELLVALGGVAAWPLAAAAQQPDQMRRLGLLMSTAADDAKGSARVAAFVGALEKFGRIDGHNVRIDMRWPTSTEEVRKDAAELIAALLAGDSLQFESLRDRISRLAMRNKYPVFASGRWGGPGQGRASRLAV
jgi:hypothetical protein